MGKALCRCAGEGAGSRLAASHGGAAQISPGGAARLEVPHGQGEGESRKRGSVEDGSVSEAPVGSILSQRMQGVLCVLVCEEGVKQDSSSLHSAGVGLSCSTS